MHALRADQKLASDTFDLMNDIEEHTEEMEREMRVQKVTDLQYKRGFIYVESTWNSDKIVFV